MTEASKTVAWLARRHAVGMRNGGRSPAQLFHAPLSLSLTVSVRAGVGGRRKRARRRAEEMGKKRAILSAWWPAAKRGLQKAAARLG